MSNPNFVIVDSILADKIIINKDRILFIEIENSSTRNFNDKQPMWIVMENYVRTKVIASYNDFLTQTTYNDLKKSERKQ
jgi:hypothetical protein